MADHMRQPACCRRKDLDLMTRSPVSYVNLIASFNDLFRGLQRRGRYYHVGIGQGQRMPIILHREPCDASLCADEKMTIRLERQCSQARKLDLRKRGLCSTPHIKGNDLIRCRISEQQQTVIDAKPNEFTKRIVSLDAAGYLFKWNETILRNDEDLKSTGIGLSKVAARIHDIHGISNMIRVAMGADIARQRNAAIPSANLEFRLASGRLGRSTSKRDQPPQIQPPAASPAGSSV